MLKALNCGKYTKLESPKSADDIIASGQVLDALNELSSAEEQCQRIHEKQGFPTSGGPYLLEDTDVLGKQTIKMVAGKAFFRYGMCASDEQVGHDQ